MARLTEAAAQHLGRLEYLLLELRTLDVGEPRVRQGVAADFVSLPAQKLGIVPGEELDWRHLKPGGAKLANFAGVAFAHHRRDEEEAGSGAELAQDGGCPPARLEPIVHAEAHVRSIDHFLRDALYSLRVGDEYVVAIKSNEKSVKGFLLVGEDVMEIDKVNPGATQGTLRPSARPPQTRQRGKRSVANRPTRRERGHLAARDDVPVTFVHFFRSHRGIP